jgi:hypothetical protein
VSCCIGSFAVSSFCDNELLVQAVCRLMILAVPEAAAPAAATAAGHDDLEEILQLSDSASCGAAALDGALQLPTRGA